jgi:hypothetical protein
MTELPDPIAVYREALASLPRREEPQPPVIERIEAWPYPDLRRVWARVQISPFAAYPDLTLTLTDPDGGIVATMFMVEIRESYQSVTLHLRQPPRPGERYALELSLERNGSILDAGRAEFELTFREPEESERNFSGRAASS